MNDQTVDYYLNALQMNNPLMNLEQTIRSHWLKYRPRMCAELTKVGRLEQFIQTAARLTEEAVFQLTSQGMPIHEAWMQVREEWAILPTETDVPELGTNPLNWQLPQFPEDED